MLSKIGQSSKVKNHMISLILKLIDTDNSKVVTRGKGVEG